MSLTLIQGAYIVAALLFILALAGLSKHESAPMGNRYGIFGMTIALVVTIIAATAGVDGLGVDNDTDGSGLMGLGLIAALLCLDLLPVVADLLSAVQAIVAEDMAVALD